MPSHRALFIVNIMLSAICVSLVFLVGAANGAVENNKPVVAIRLDDVQAWYCVKIAETIIDAVTVASAVPINIGVIGISLDTQVPSRHVICPSCSWFSSVCFRNAWLIFCSHPQLAVRIVL